MAFSSTCTLTIKIKTHNVVGVNIPSCDADNISIIKKNAIYVRGGHYNHLREVCWPILLEQKVRTNTNQRAYKPTCSDVSHYS